MPCDPFEWWQVEILFHKPKYYETADIIKSTTLQRNLVILNGSDENLIDIET
jgi:hypothetical protein